MEMLSATRLPEKTEKLRLPRVTLRPRAVGELRFQRGTEGIGVDKQRYEQNSQQQENDDGDENAYQRMLLHGRHLYPLS